MQAQLKKFFTELSLTQLVATYNLANPRSPVKTFTNRNSALKRVTSMIDGWGAVSNAAEGYENFFADFAVTMLDAVGEELPPPSTAGQPALDSSLAGEEKVDAKGRKIKASAKTQPKAHRKSPTQSDNDSINAPPWLNLRCTTCNYLIKTTAGYLAVGRLLCPVNKSHGMLLTKAERDGALADKS